MTLEQALELRHDDLQTANTKSAPDAVSPVPLDGVQVRGERLQATSGSGIVERHQAEDPGLIAVFADRVIVTKAGQHFIRACC